jgi:FlaA1/EpsC-like NDP-sugar epimerase
MSDAFRREPVRRMTAQARSTPQSFASFSSILTDVVVWLFATELVALARYDFNAANVRWEVISVLALFLAGGQLVLGAFVLLYRGRYLPGSFDELRALAVSVTGVSALASVAVLVAHPNGIPRSVPFLAWPMALVGMAAIRYIKRLITETGIRPTDAERVLIFGAGWVGSTLVSRMLLDPKSALRPVGFLDDDPAKRNLQVRGVRVCGGFADLAHVVRRLDATRVVIAVNYADAALIRKISDAADELGIGCMVLPPLTEQLRRSQLQLSALRDVDVEDVIGRRPVDTDVTSIAAYITGKRVLVTGAGGSIGSELCRQLHKFGPLN